MQFRNSMELIFYKSYSDLKAEASRSYLGFLWWIIEPIIYLCAFYILFVLVLQRGGENFVPTFLCGAVVFKWFSSGVNGGSNAIAANKGLLQQVYVPKYIFPAIAVLGSTARFIPVFLIFVLFLLIYGISPQSTWLAAPLIMLIQFCLVMSLAMLVGAVTPFLPDLKVAIENGMLMLFFLSGIFFDINEVSEPVRSYLLLNPMAGLIDEYRDVMIRGNWPDMDRLGVIFLISLAIFAIGLGLLKHLDHRYGKVRF